MVTHAPAASVRVYSIRTDRQSRTARLCGLAVGLLVMLSLVVTGPTDAFAQEPAIQVEQFEPLPDQHTNILNVSTADTLGHLVYSTGALFHFVSSPLRAVELDQNEEVGELETLIDNQFKGEVFGALGLSDWFDFGVVIPVIFTQSGGGFSDGPTDLGNGIDGAAVGDIRVITRVKALPREWAEGFGIAVEGIWYIPSGDDETYNGESFRGEPRLVLDYQLDPSLWPFEVALNVGYLIREERQLLNIKYDDVVRMSLATRVGLGYPGLEAIGTVFGSIQTSDDVSSLDPSQEVDGFRTSPVETLLGVSYTAPFGLYSNIGAGTGLNDAVGAPTYRIFASVGFLPLDDDTDDDTIVDSEDSCVERPEDFDGFQDDDGCPDTDNDDDGIADTADSCPDDPEDDDDFEPDDGCPEADNDEDGIADADDQCINDPEDIDEFEDDDGCPDDDNDEDTIADADDQCPDQPEDMDSFMDEDGCPDDDNDEDGIVDAKDGCPDEPETVNEWEDDDGCPDEKPLVVVTEEKLEIGERVFFETNKAKIKKVSYPVLDAVVEALKENPQITEVRVEGHTDDVGKASYNKRLSRKRAKAVRQYLKDKGISRKRLDYKGYGEEHPIAPNDTDEGRSKNRRVEFTILEVDGEKLKTKY